MGFLPLPPLCPLSHDMIAPPCALTLNPLSPPRGPPPPLCRMQVMYTDSLIRIFGDINQGWGGGLLELIQLEH